MDEDTGLKQRELVSEEDLLVNHSQDMYLFLKSTLKFEYKVPINMAELFSPDFELKLDKLNSQYSNEEPNKIGSETLSEVS